MVIQILSTDVKNESLCQCLSAVSPILTEILLDLLFALPDLFHDSTLVYRGMHKQVHTLLHKCILTFYNCVQLEPQNIFPITCLSLLNESNCCSRLCPARVIYMKSLCQPGKYELVFHFLKFISWVSIVYFCKLVIIYISSLCEIFDFLCPFFLLSCLSFPELKELFKYVRYVRKG